MASPIRISHIVLQTNNPKALQDWYCTVLEGEMVHDAGLISFMSYDDEHHRVAFINPGALEPRKPGADGPQDLRAGRESGLHHIAFTLASLGDLLETYARLKAKGIVPFWCINHGVTTSMYFHDPDNNQVELQVDNFATAKAGKAFMQSEAFAKNPIGVEYDPDDFVARFRAGVAAEELTRPG
jgi:catechol-2,3-dioxygenase